MTAVTPSPADRLDAVVSLVASPFVAAVLVAVVCAVLYVRHCDRKGTR